jgi:DNA-directed RNA polymerase specialized sigma24 family protein
LTEDPVTLWLTELRNADEIAAAKIWGHFVDRVRALARNRLNVDSRRVYDDEDVAQSAFNSVFQGVAEGRYPDLRDRNCLWQLIMIITARKVTYRHRYDRRKCRDTKRSLSECLFVDPDSLVARANRDYALSREPSAELTAEFVETYELLFKDLNDTALENVVALRMEGFSDSEIADRLQCSRRTVQRRLEIIRRHWERMEFSSE